MFSKYLVSALTATLATAGQVGFVVGPAPTVVYDAPTHSLRPLMGVPGSYHIADPIINGLNRASVSPDGTSAFIIINGEGAVVRGLGSGSTSVYSVPAADLVVWTQSAKLLIQYDSRTGSLRRVATTSPEPVVGSDIRLVGMEGEVVAMSANSDGTQILLAVKDASRGGFYGLSDDGSFTQVLSTADPGPSIFTSNGIIATDHESGRLIRFTDVLGGSEPLTFAGESDPLPDPVGLALSQDQTRLYVASGSSRLIREYRIDSLQFVRDIALDAPPLGLAPLPGQADVLALGPRSKVNDPMWLIDVRSKPAVSFVPATME